MKFIIKDWAGNTKFNGELFNSFEDAWERVYEHFTDLEGSDFDEAVGEFEVYEVPNEN